MRLLLNAALCAALAMGGFAYAEAPQPVADFSAKFVKVPKKGEKRKIVQISPEEHALFWSPQSTPEPETPQSDQIVEDLQIGSFAVFWGSISPALADSGPGRLFPALDAIAGQRSVPQPRLQQLQNIARANGVHILRSTVGTRVSPALVLAVIAVESSGQVDAVSSAGAQGLMQLMPATAERFGVEDSLSAQENIAGGVQYLDWLMGEFDSDPIMVLAGYNAGEGNLRKHEGVPPFAETRDYVPKVLAAFQVARGLCLTPPELLSDGCVFAGLN